MMNTNELFRMPPHEGKPRLREAWRYITSRPDISLVILNVFFAATFGLNFQISNTLFATQVFHKDAGQYGILGSFIAIGAVIAALVATKRGKRTPYELIWFAAGFGLLEIFKIFGLGVLSDAFVFTIASALLWLYLLFLSNAKYNKPWGYLVFGSLVALWCYVTFGKIGRAHV